MKEQISLQEYIESIEKIKLLIDEVDDYTPLDSLKTIELMKAAEIVEAFEDIHFKLTKPTNIDRTRFYFEQRFKYGQLSRSRGNSNELDIIIKNWNDLRNLANELLLEREFFRIYAAKYLPQLSNSSQLKIINCINDIITEKKLFIQTHKG